MINVNNVFWSAIPSLVAVIAIILLTFERLCRKERKPFSEKDRFLRPPGETLRLELDRLNDKLYTRLMVVGGAAMITSLLSLPFVQSSSRSTSSLIISLGTVIVLGLIMWTWNVAERIHNVYLGFQGERAVGEELNRLMLNDCRVYHDVQMNGIGNIDHVVVAPHAVFAVETKAKRKRWKVKGEDDYKMRFDGKGLTFPPDGSDIRMLQQTTRNAKKLSDYLSRLTRERVEVKPILTFPGWWIERVGKGEVNVLNPKELRSAILDSKAPLLDKIQRQRIIELLEEKCRDVEF